MEESQINMMYYNVTFTITRSEYLKLVKISDVTIMYEFMATMKNTYVTSFYAAT